jgi:hypothetical protein
MTNRFQFAFKSNLHRYNLVSAAVAQALNTECDAVTGEVVQVGTVTAHCP